MRYNDACAVLYAIVIRSFFFLIFMHMNMNLLQVLRGYLWYKLQLHSSKMIIMPAIFFKSTIYVKIL